jgi:pilus assembly protein CpaF
MLAQDSLVQQVVNALLEGEGIALQDGPRTAQRETHVEVSARRVLTKLAPGIRGVQRQDVITAVIDEVLGLGPLQPLLDDPDVAEIMVNSPTEIYYERDGVLYLSATQFRDEEHIRRIAERIMSPLARTVDDSFPMVDARLPDGSRVNIVLPPIAVDSPMITIRKFQADRFDMEGLIRIGTITEDASAFLRACVAAKVNILISGASGTGKTTLMNALSGFIPVQERIVVVEDPTELQLRQPHTVRLEARPSAAGGQGEVTQRDLVRNAMRMRPDRIIVGEVRGPEAFDLIQAMNTGHEGSITTAHANSPREALTRVENMIMMAGFDLPLRSVREQIAAAMHLVIQIARMPDGSRRVTYISEIAGLEGDGMALENLFVFQGKRVDRRGRVDGELLATGIRPRFAGRLEEYGIADPSVATWEDATRTDPRLDLEREYGR